MAVFTDKFIKGLKPGAERYEERDAGCPGLSLRVGVRGEKIWTVIAAQDGSRRRIRLGTYPDTSLAMARRMAAERRAAPELHTAGLRVADLWEMYQREAAASRRAFKDVRQVWTKWAAPIIGRVRLDDLTMRHGAELISHVAKHSTPNRARKVIRYLSPMLTFAAGRGLMPGNPWAGLHLPEGVARRDRVLNRAEWASVWGWAMGAPYRLAEVELGQDPDGDPVTTCRVEPCDAPDRKPKIRGAAFIALQALDDALARHGAVRQQEGVPSCRVVSIEKWREMADRHGLSDSDDPDSRGRAFRRAAKTLRERGYVRQYSELAWRGSEK